MSSSDLPVVCPSPAPAGLASVYMVVGEDAAFYVGSARDVQRRIQQHEVGRGAKFTREHGMARLAYVEGPMDLATAIRREFQLKRWSRAKKESLLSGNLDRLRQLSRSHRNRASAAPKPSS